MGVRYRSATPGTLLSLVATVLLALVSFNTPLLKSIYFLEANFSSGQYAGTLRLGTLGYCLDTGGGENCEGPRVGYSFDPNDLLGVSMFDIPEAITRYLTYVLILHVVALALAVASTIFGLLSHISSMSVMCFPTCFAALASTCSLIALVFDLAMFYIAKARIDSVNGASASIGMAVWLTLAAWLLCGFAGCAYGVGRCCVGSRDRDRRSSNDPKNGDYYRAPSGNGPDAMRMDAIRDEQMRKKEQGLPSFAEYERTPLTRDDDKFAVDDPTRQMPGALRRDGSLVQGVGVGYGRRTGPETADYHVGYAGGPQGPQSGLGRRPSDSMMTDAGNAGLGAGGGGVESSGYAAGYGQYNSQDPYQNGNQQYGGSYGQQPYNNGYNDPYANNQHQYPPQQDPYAQSRTPDPYGQSRTPDPYAASRSADPYAASRTPDPYGGQQNSNPYANVHTPNPYDQQQRASANDPYGGYDDGLGAIGMAATTASSPDRGYSGAGAAYHAQPSIQAPQPQHLASSHHASNLLRSPVSAHDGGYGGQQRHDIVGQNGYNDDQIDQGGGVQPLPPSYGVATGSSGQSYQPRPEKSGYH